MLKKEILYHSVSGTQMSNQTSISFESIADGTYIIDNSLLVSEGIAAWISASNGGEVFGPAVSGGAMTSRAVTTGNNNDSSGFEKLFEGALITVEVKVNTADTESCFR